MGHGCHDCGSPNDCECPETIARREKLWDCKYIDGRYVPGEELVAKKTQPSGYTRETWGELEKVAVTSPSHYVDTDVEPIDAIEAWNLNFRLANVIKYIARCGKKPGVDSTDDLRKARAYLSREIARLEGRHAWE